MVQTPSRQPRCIVCNTPLAEPRWRFYGNVCSHWRCRLQFHVELQRRYEEGLRREWEYRRQRSQLVVEFWERVSAEMEHRLPESIVPVPLPANTRPLTKLPSQREREFRAHLRRVVEAAFAANPPPVAASRPLAEEAAVEDDSAGSPLLQAACAVCQGRCCLYGGHEAHISQETVCGYLVSHPQASAQDVFGQYDAYSADFTYEDSCVCHQQRGCGLPRRLRSRECNRFQCDRLRDLESLCAEHPSAEHFLLAAIEGSRVVRCVLVRRCEAAEVQVICQVPACPAYRLTGEN